MTHMAVVPRLLRVLREKVEDRLDDIPAWQRRAVDALLSVNELATLKKPTHAVSSTLLAPVHERFGGKLRFLFCGGAFVDPDDAKFFHRIGIPVVIGYGLTEAGTVVALNDLRPFRADTVGRPVDGTRVEVRDPDTTGHGEVWVAGPTVMQGYFKEPLLTREVLTDGWLRTGDIGRIDASGHLKLVGRRKNMIVTAGGKNVYPEDVETAFDGISGCEELCVFSSSFLGESRSLTDERLIVVMRPQEGEAPDPALESIQERNRRLADYKRAAQVLVWDQPFPRTASMKVKRNKLAEQIVGAGKSIEIRELKS